MDNDPRDPLANFIKSFHLNPCQEVVESVLELPWPSPSGLPYQFLIINGWRMVLKLPGQIPTAFLGKFDMENDPGAPLSKSIRVPDQFFIIS